MTDTLYIVALILVILSFFQKDYSFFWLAGVGLACYSIAFMSEYLPS